MTFGAGEPLEIPMPTREDFLRNLEKVTPKPDRDDQNSG